MSDPIDLQEMGKMAKRASKQMAQASSIHKQKALYAIANGIKNRQKEILEKNREDLSLGEKSGMDGALLDRLSLQKRLEGVVADLLKVAALPDPIGETFAHRRLPNGLNLCKQRTALGVLGVIYEARPNVTVDVAALTIQTGNSAILRGGSETLKSNLILVEVIQEALQQVGLPVETIQLIKSTDRTYVYQLLQMHESIDLIIPRGGASLHEFCRKESRIPVITGGIGICHLFVDDSADLAQSIEVIHNAKTQRPTVCNALDTLLVHEKIAASFLPQLVERLEKSGVAFRVNAQAFRWLLQRSSVQEAVEADWNREWLSLTLGIKVVKNLEEAIQHIQHYSSGHSDGILTDTLSHAEEFVRAIDSAAVYVNASTRFTDGGQFGLGAEVAISTQKLHARGPMGIEELTSYKWIIRGNYHARVS